MPYFRELPNLKYASVFNERTGIDEYTLVKNIFKRPKVREDFKNIITAFTYYQIQDNERPDQIAEKYYNNSQLDWIILLTNNITNYNEQWPLDNNSLYKYLLDKYGSEEVLYDVHHYETVEYKDEFGRVLIEGGLIVDTFSSIEVNTNTSSNSYLLESFPSAKSNTIVKVNLNQRLSVYDRSGREITTNITDIRTTVSYLKITTADKTGANDVAILNALTNWPQSWSGILRVNLRNGQKFDINVNDIVLDNKVVLSDRLYEITGTLVDGEIRPTFNFTNEVTQ
jgi:hypothetical protein